MASQFGRKVVAYKVNKSGGGVIAGDVLVPDTSNDNAFTTTTSAAVTTGAWVADETIASNATGRVVIGGHVSLINVSASVTRGHTGTTHTVAKQAVSTGGTTRSAGTFCKFTTGGTTPEADLWPVDLGAGSGELVASSVLWDAAGDLAVGTGADTAAKLSIGTAGKSLVSTGSTAAWGYQYGTLLAIVQNTAGGNKSTSSATSADVDATNAIITFTAPASGNVLVRVTCVINLPSTTNANAFFGLRESTTNLVNSGGSPAGSVVGQGQTTNAVEGSVTWAAYLTGVSAGAHTYKLAFAANSSMTFTVRASAANPMILEVWSCP